MPDDSAHEVHKMQLYESFVESSQDAYLAVRQDGTIEYASRAVQALLGYEPEDVIGKNVADWLQGEDLERALIQLGESYSHLARGVTRFGVQAADGNVVPIEIAASSVSDGDREFLGLCARDGRDQALIESVLGQLLQGEERESALRTVLDTIGWRSMGSKVAIDWVDEGGHHEVKTGDFDDSLGGPEETGDDAEADPWTRSRLTLEPQLGGVTDE
ncbi:MAG TPA: PAS domain S-box protein, partial [Acidimicrobiales bacterium]|nr:PAS domain S-box protein [Acidimicrobiales bacterium]